jgi:hypothetical protein
MRVITSCSLFKVNRRFGKTFRLHLQSRKIYREINQRESRRQAEAKCFSETSADFQRTTWFYIPEDGTHHNHRCENLRSYIMRVVPSRRMRWTGRLACKGETRSEYKILVGKFVQKRTLRIPKRRCEDIIRMDLKETWWMHVTPERNEAGILWTRW